MTTSRTYVLLIIVRLRVVTANQIVRMCEGRVGRSTVYLRLRELLKERFIRRTSHSVKIAYFFTATEKGQELAFGRDDRRIQVIKESDVFHHFAVSEALEDIFHFQNVIGFATENELSPAEIKRFSFNRRPDAILQVKAELPSKFEMALEIESSLKSVERIGGILDSYEKAFHLKLNCHGAMIVCTRRDIYTAYLERIRKRSPEFQNCILLLLQNELKNLDTLVYGVRTNTIGISLDFLRTESSRGVSYIPIKSIA